MKRIIIFYAPLGKNTPPDKIGGAEAGCLKTKAIYEKAGYEVKVIDKPTMSKGKMQFIIEMALVLLTLVCYILRYGRKSPVHIVGFNTKIAFYEEMLMNISHFMGCKVIYEIRNGSMVQTYLEGTDRYKKTLKSLLLKPEVVLCQGLEYVDFIKEKWGVERQYYPNYIMDEYVQLNNLNRGNKRNIIYFGRVTESKNVDIIIETVGLLRNVNVDVHLDVIGGYSEEYKQRLDDIVKKLNLEECVTFYGRKPFDFIADKLRASHYFVFPSTEKQEGHSNSLTESMGCGVVPIVSRAGFNVSICGNYDLVVNDVKSRHFADRILEIERSGKWSYYSTFVYERIKNNYTQTIVGMKLIGYIEKLWK